MPVIAHQAITVAIPHLPPHKAGAAIQFARCARVDAAQRLADDRERHAVS